jgi:coenzyme PQQ precursor peptide PqqA
MARLAPALYVEGSSHIDGESMHFEEVRLMEWTKPDFTVVAVTMEVTAYAATK